MKTNIGNIDRTIVKEPAGDVAAKTPATPRIALMVRKSFSDIMSGTTAIAALLTARPTLTDLTLYMNDIGDRGATKV